MFTYAVVEIAGRQYKVSPEAEFVVNFLGDQTQFECDKVLMIADSGKVQIGDPYLKQKLIFDVVETVRGKKVRVSTYHAKANTRKTIGSRAFNTKLKLKGEK